MTREKMSRIDATFLLELKRIQQQRMAANLDNMRLQDMGRLISIRRLTMAIRRHPSWPVIKKDIIKADLKEEDLG